MTWRGKSQPFTTDEWRVEAQTFIMDDLKSKSQLFTADDWRVESQNFIIDDL